MRRPLVLERLESRVVPGLIAPLGFDTSFNPTSMAVGDFNGDGIPDLVTGSLLLLGNGDGTFRPAVPYEGAGGAVTVADFNGDGIPDLVGLGGGSVRVLLGNGDGTFRPPFNSPVPTGAVSLAVGDFNGDGITDVAVANLLFQGSVSVLLGHGDGTFGPAVTYAAGVRSYSVAVGDFTGNGVLDLAVANQGTSPLYRDSSVSVLMGNGNGTFRPAVNYAVAGGEAVSVAVGDFTGDGVADLAVATGADSLGNGGGVSVLLGRGNGTFQAAVHYAVGGLLAVADFNGDGIPDLAVTDGHRVGVALGNGDGTFQAAVNYSSVGVAIGSVAVGDFNGDGALDLALPNIGSVTVLLGNGDGTFRAAPSYGTGDSPYSVAVADFNGDGIPDLAVANGGHGGAYGTHGSVSVLLGNGDGTFQPALNYEDPYQPVSVAVGDFNGDGIPDLVVANFGHPDVGNPGWVDVRLGNGDGTFRPPVGYLVGDGPVSVAVGDFDGDGTPDIAVANQNSNNVSILLGNGDGTFRAAANYMVGVVPLSVAVGDFNDDGKFDLAVANAFSNNVSVLLGNGDGTFRPAINSAAGNYPESVAVGDFNGDGVPDLAVAPFNSNTVSVLLGNGDGTFQQAVNYAVGGGPDSVAVGDFNGDGIPDLAVAFGDAVRVLLGNGDGTFQTTPISYVAGSIPSSVAVGDFNGDGFPDLAVTNLYSNDVSILFNDGSWPGPAPGPGGARGRESGSHGSAQALASFVLPTPALAVWADEWPGAATPRRAVPTQPLLLSAVVDALLAAAPRNNSAAPVAGTPLAFYEPWSMPRWHSRIQDFDLLAETLVTPAWEQE